MVYMQNSRDKEQNIMLAENAPDLFLAGDTPRMIDEWQIIPFIWNQISFEVDHRGRKRQFILTGSSTPVSDSAYEHSGIIRMRPMAPYESKDSNGTISLERLFNHPETFTPSKCSLGLTDYAYLLCRGDGPVLWGWKENRLWSRYTISMTVLFMMI